MRAKLHIKNEITEAKKLYQAVLLAFSSNVRAKKELATLKNYKQDDSY